MIATFVELRTQNVQPKNAGFHQGNVLNFCRWSSNSAVGGPQHPHCCGSFTNGTTALLPRLQDVEDREKENQAGISFQQKRASKNMYERFEGWDRRNKKGEDMIQSKTRDSGSQQRVFSCMRSVMCSQFAGTRGWRKGRTDLALPHDWCRYSSHDVQPGSSRTSINSRTTIQGSCPYRQANALDLMLSLAFVWLRIQMVYLDVVQIVVLKSDALNHPEPAGKWTCICFKTVEQDSHNIC